MKLNNCITLIVLTLTTVSSYSYSNDCRTKCDETLKTRARCGGDPIYAVDGSLCCKFHNACILSLYENCKRENRCMPRKYILIYFEIFCLKLKLFVFFYP